MSTTDADASSTRDMVRRYYSERVRSRGDLQSSCCSTVDVPAEHARILAMIDDEVLEKFYGCGSPIPEALEGLTVLDLGCGSGRDCYLLSKLVGEHGRVIGVDMTDDQLDVARRHVDSMTSKYGYAKPNVEFRAGYIEDLAACGVEDASVDLVVSNCVINLSPDKANVFSEIFRVLRPGGELYFADVYCDRRVATELKTDPLFYGECLGGALYEEDLRRILASVGCLDPAIMQKTRIEIENRAMEEKAGNAVFHSITVRAFKLASLEDRSEDYGQVAIYQGTLPGCPRNFTLDQDHLFETGRPMPVSGNSAAKLAETRFGEHFQIAGDRNQHFGLFDPGGESKSDPEDDAPSSGCC